MAKKPILTDEFPGAGPGEDPHGPTRPVDGQPSAAATCPAEIPSAGRDASGHARPRTRIQGFRAAASPGSAQTIVPPVGWLVVTEGPGRGAALALVSGMNGIGRGDGVRVQLDFGDDAISRDAHAYVSYDDAARRFYVSHNGKTNLVRRNGVPVLATEALGHGDTLRIGATTLRFVALCGDDFDWSLP